MTFIFLTRVDDGCIIRINALHLISYESDNEDPTCNTLVHVTNTTIRIKESVEEIDSIIQRCK